MAFANFEVAHGSGRKAQGENTLFTYGQLLAADSIVSDR
ncbi:hypothetical protein D1BOALGB6SA_5072 [Olavius sp. associated proteobacterium Delta 1]|nr:hypothetical protein D1BOALGB6SA_5072 [Olavius sp. associated proteobacterium Delta 1]